MVYVKVEIAGEEVKTRALKSRAGEVVFIERF